MLIRTKLQSPHPRGESVWSDDKQVVRTTVTRVHPHSVFVVFDDLFEAHFA